MVCRIDITCEDKLPNKDKLIISISPYKIEREGGLMLYKCLKNQYNKIYFSNDNTHYYTDFTKEDKYVILKKMLYKKIKEYDEIIIFGSSKGGGLPAYLSNKINLLYPNKKIKVFFFNPYIVINNNILNDIKHIRGFAPSMERVLKAGKNENFLNYLVDNKNINYYYFSGNDGPDVYYHNLSYEYSLINNINNIEFINIIQFQNFVDAHFIFFKLYETSKTYHKEDNIYYKKIIFKDIFLKTRQSIDKIYQINSKYEQTFNISNINYKNKLFDIPINDNKELMIINKRTNRKLIIKKEGNYWGLVDNVDITNWKNNDSIIIYNNI